MSDIERKVRVAISVGDVNGIGIEVILKTLSNKDILEFFTPIIFASTKVLSFHKDKLKIEGAHFQVIQDAAKCIDNKINVINCWNEPINVQFGKVNKEAGIAAYLSLKSAAEAVMKGEADVLVTAPINKDNIQSNEFNFPGHTEYLAEVWKGNPLMFMISDKLKVGLLTQHIPLKEVTEHITQETIIEKIRIINKSLKEDFCVEKPKIAVLALNPHAGDNGLLGKEEIEVINPTLERLREQNILAYGPYPADSFFTQANLSFFDGILAMYHDQGLIPFKTISFEEGVNYTANLPFVRTSPDHGVAYDIAGKGIADEESFKTAIYTAVKLFSNRTEYKELIKNKLISKALKAEKGE